MTVTVTNPGGQSGSLGSGFTYLAPPTVSSVSPEQRIDGGRDGGDDHGDELCRGSDGDVWRAAATNVVVVNSTTITATTPAGSAGAVTVTVNGERAKRESNERIHLCSDPDGEQCVAEQRTDSGRDGGDDHRDELCLGSDGDVWRNGGDERGGGEQHDDHGDDAGQGVRER